MRYRRHWLCGATYFFTVVLRDRESRLLVDEIDALRTAIADVRRRHPFRIDACVVLPEHLHLVWTLPEREFDVPLRWALIKSQFSRSIVPRESSTVSRRRKRERNIWQRRYWEHRIRDEDDMQKHVDYIHFNPVKHGHAEAPAAWPFSSIHRYIALGMRPADWGCSTRRSKVAAPDTASE